MKALTTMLAERAMNRMETPADGLKPWRDAAQAQLAEPVIDACLMSRPSSYGAAKAASSAGLLATMLLRKHQEQRAGGLPQHFLLAVTADDVVALRRTMTARSGPLGEPGEEVARWRRAELIVGWAVRGYLLDVTLTSSRGPRVECCVAKAPLSASFLELLADPARGRPAAAYSSSAGILRRMPSA